MLLLSGRSGVECWSVKDVGVVGMNTRVDYRYGYRRCFVVGYQLQAFKLSRTISNHNSVADFSMLGCTFYLSLPLCANWTLINALKWTKMFITVPNIPQQNIAYDRRDNKKGKIRCLVCFSVLKIFLKYFCYCFKLIFYYYF
jgi:hypothetical protein